MLTDENLLVDRPHKNGIGGQQRIYRFKNGMGLSMVNAPMIHSYPFAWEAAVLKGVTDSGDFAELSYETPLIEDVEVFMDDEAANAFIARAASLFNL